jgi:hypothetical protein
MTKKFHELFVNTGQWREVVWIDAEGKERRIDFDKMPESYKKMYVLSLRMQGFEVPVNLRKYIDNNPEIVLEWELDGFNNV